MPAQRSSANRGDACASKDGPQGVPIGLLDEAWEPHLGSAYAMASMLLNDGEAAERAVVLAMLDLYRAPLGSVMAEATLRTLARHVFWHSQNMTPSAKSSRGLPPSMVWLGQLAHMQRICLALCVYGGHTHRQAAALLGVSPASVAQVLTAGLSELGYLNPHLENA